jgi:tRNA(Ile)-lysidine synthase
VTSAAAGRPRADHPAVAPLLARCHFPAPGTAVTCAVSGGADSTALLALALAAGLDVEAVHVDHRLRPGSGDDARAVAELGDRWSVPVRVVEVSVPAGGDLEARAREARHAAVGSGALFGHTAEDQAETVLLRLLRGTGPSGLAAMRPDRHPLLSLRRSETVDLCAALGVVPRRDPTNSDPAMRRNRVRHEVLPLLDDVAGRDVVPLLCRLADLAAGQADVLGALADGIDPTDARALAALPEVLAGEVVRRWWGEVTASPHPPDAAAVRRVLGVAAGHAVACDVAAGWRVARTAGRLRLERAGPVRVAGVPGAGTVRRR